MLWRFKISHINHNWLLEEVEEGVEEMVEVVDLGLLNSLEEEGLTFPMAGIMELDNLLETEEDSLEGEEVQIRIIEEEEEEECLEEEDNPLTRTLLRISLR